MVWDSVYVATKQTAGHLVVVWDQAYHCCVGTYSPSPPVGGPSFSRSLSIIYFVLDLSWMQQINPMTALPEMVYFAGDKDSCLMSQSVSCLIDYLCETDFPPHRWASSELTVKG